MATMPVGKLLRELAAPAMLAMSANAIFNICDILIVSRGIGIDAIAGLACTFPIVIFISAIAALTNVGSSTLTSMLLAQNNQERAQKVVDNSFVMSLVTGLTVTFVFEFFLDDILRLCGASDATLPYAHDYMRMMLFGTFILFSMQSMGRLLHVLGRPKEQMIVQLGGITMNIILDALFVFVFKWGMTGAALATVLCQIVSWIIFVFLLSDKDSFLHFSLKGLKLDLSVLRDVLSIGISPFATNACGCIVALMINRSLIEVGGDHGDLYMGTYAIIQRITQVLVLLVSGMAQGMQPIASFNIARQDYIRVRRVLMLAIFGSSVIMCVGYGIIAVFTENIVNVFTNNPEMMSICVPALTIGLCTFPFVGSQMVAVSFFHAIKQPRVSMTISLSRQLLFLIPMLIFLPHIIGVTGVWWSMALADVASVTISWIMLYTETKKLSL